jgi:excisionase family DNA binding protein
MQVTSSENRKPAAVRLLRPASNNVALGPWMTAEQAATYLALSLKALYQQVRRGLPAHRLGRRLRFSRVELDEVLARR